MQLFAHESVLHFAPIANWPALEDFAKEDTMVGSPVFKWAISILLREMPIFGNILDLELQSSPDNLEPLR